MGSGALEDLPSVYLNSQRYAKICLSSSKQGLSYACLREFAIKRYNQQIRLRLSRKNAQTTDVYIKVVDAEQIPHQSPSQLDGSDTLRDVYHFHSPPSPIG